MKFTIGRDEFASALKRVLPFTDAKSPMVILGHVRITVTNTKLALTAANNTFHVTSELGLETANVVTAGEVCVGADHFSGLVSSLRADQPVEVEHNTPGGPISIRSGRTVASFNAARGDDMPMYGAIFPDPQIKLSAGELDRVLAITKPCMGIDTDRMIFWGVSFRYERACALVAACNGTFGSISRICHTEVSDFPEFILPRSLCVRLRGLLKNATGMIEMAITPLAIRIVSSDWVIHSKLVDGEFPSPDIWGARPVDEPVIANSEELSAILTRIDRATELDNIKLKQRGASALINNNTMLLRDSHNVVTDVMEVEYEGVTPTSFGLNTRQVRDAIYALDTKEIELHFTNHSSPIRVCARNETHDGFTTVPFRV